MKDTKINFPIIALGYGKVDSKGELLNVHFEKIGIVGGDKISIKNIGDEQVSVLKRSFETSIEQISH